MKKTFLILLVIGCTARIFAQGSLQLTSGTYLTGSGALYMVVSDLNVVNNGSIALSATGNTVIVNGSTSTSLSGSGTTQLNNLTNSTSSTFTLAAPVAVYNQLGIQSGTLSSAGYLTLKSLPANTALVLPITSGTISGDVTVERYLSSNTNRAYRLLSPSVNTAGSTKPYIRDNWQEGANNPNTSTNNNPVATYGTHITGSTSGANGFDATQTGNASLYIHNNTLAQWQTIANTNATNLSATTGYLLFVRGDRSMDLNSTSSPLPSSNTTLRATGTLLTGTQTFSGLTLNDGGVVSNGFNLLANPYAAPINWASVQAASSGITQFYYYWDPNLGSRGNYVSVATDNTKSIPSSTVDTVIQSGQAFFVQTVQGAATPQVVIQESHKSTTNNKDVFRVGVQIERLSTSLYFTDEQGQRRLADGVLSRYKNSYSKQVDGEDAVQMEGFDEDIAIARGGRELSIESRPLIDATDTIALAIARLKQRGYEWQFDATAFNAPGLQATLVDKYLITRTPLSLTSTTVIPFTVDGNAASSAADRFMIVFAGNTPLPLNVLTVKAYQKAPGIQVEWSSLTEDDISRYEVEKSVDGQQFAKAAGVAAIGKANTYTWLDAGALSGNNYYRIKAVGRAGEEQWSKIVSVSLGTGSSGFAIYPNPVTEGVLTVQLNNVAKGSYRLRLYNQAGQKVLEQTIEHAGSSAAETLHLDEKLPAGVYQLHLSGNGKTFVEKLLKN